MRGFLLWVGRFQSAISFSVFHFIILISPKKFFVFDSIVIILVLRFAMISPKKFFSDDLVITLVLGLRLPDRGGSLHTMKEDSLLYYSI